MKKKRADSMNQADAWIHQVDASSLEEKIKNIHHISLKKRIKNIHHITRNVCICVEHELLHFSLSPKIKEDPTQNQRKISPRRHSPRHPSCRCGSPDLGAVGSGPHHHHSAAASSSGRGGGTGIRDDGEVTGHRIR